MIEEYWAKSTIRFSFFTRPLSAIFTCVLEFDKTLSQTLIVVLVWYSFYYLFNVLSSFRAMTSLSSTCISVSNIYEKKKYTFRLLSFYRFSFKLIFLRSSAASISGVSCFYFILRKIHLLLYTHYFVSWVFFLKLLIELFERCNLFFLAYANWRATSWLLLSLSLTFSHHKITTPACLWQRKKPKLSCWWIR